MAVIVYSSIMIENRPESLRTVRSIGGPKFLVAQAFTGPFGWLTRTLNRESVGRGFESRPAHVRPTSDAIFQDRSQEVIVFSSFMPTVRSSRSATSADGAAVGVVGGAAATGGRGLGRLFALAAVVRGNHGDVDQAPSHLHLQTQKYARVVERHILETSRASRTISTPSSQSHKASE